MKIGDIIRWSEDYSNTEYHVTDFRCNVNNVNVWKLEWEDTSRADGKRSFVWEPESNLLTGLSEGWIINTTTEIQCGVKRLTRHDF
jgi:hypothetical protein